MAISDATCARFGGSRHRRGRRDRRARCGDGDARALSLPPSRCSLYSVLPTVAARSGRGGPPPPFFFSPFSTRFHARNCAFFLSRRTFLQMHKPRHICPTGEPTSQWIQFLLFSPGPFFPRPQPASRRRRRLPARVRAASRHTRGVCRGGPRPPVPRTPPPVPGRAGRCEPREGRRDLSAGDRLAGAGTRGRAWARGQEGGRRNHRRRGRGRARRWRR